MPSGDLGSQGRAIMRVAGRKTGENRWVRAVYKATSVTARSLSRVVHVLWLEVTGLLFLLFAMVGAAAAYREYQHRAAPAASGKTLLAASFALLFTYFGVSSFYRSRRRNKSR